MPKSGLIFLLTLIWTCTTLEIMYISQEYCLAVKKYISYLRHGYLTNTGIDVSKNKNK